MADVVKKFSGTMPNTETILQDGGTNYTPASGRIFIITEIVICNKAASDYYGKVKIGSVYYLTTGKIQTLKTLDSGAINIPLLAGENIAVHGEAASSLDYIICGVEVDA